MSCQHAHPPGMDKSSRPTFTLLAGVHIVQNHIPPSTSKIIFFTSPPGYGIFTPDVHFSPLSLPPFAFILPFSPLFSIVFMLSSFFFQIFPFFLLNHFVFPPKKTRVGGRVYSDIYTLEKRQKCQN
jgi:hypothetical protein